MNSFLLSAAVIFVAELGDKSQLIAIAFVAKYRARDVMLGITVATAVVHLASVGIGRAIGESFTNYQGALSIAAGIAFIGFALWTVRGDKLTSEEMERTRSSTGLAMVVVGTVFLLAEVGDKTMLATITLATREGWFGTWVGSTVGMVAADALAIGVGSVMTTRLSVKSVKVGAVALFAIFALLLIGDGIYTVSR